jgi:hypothetical protein
MAAALLRRAPRALARRAAPARAFRLKPGQVGTAEPHELLPPGGLVSPCDLRPPFTPSAAHAKLTQLAATWNTGDPGRIAELYAPGARAHARTSRSALARPRAV